MKDKIAELLKHALSVLPFVLMTADGTVKLNGARIMEGVIIAAIAGLLSGYVAVKELGVKIFSIESQVSALDTKINKLDDRLYEYVTDTNKRIENKESKRGYKTKE